MTREALREALKQPSPCDDCHHAAKCRSEYLACAAFVLFLNGRSQSRWKLAQRTPDRKKYQGAAA